jgi:hypothetical protein
MHVEQRRALCTLVAAFLIVAATSQGAAAQGSQSAAAQSCAATAGWVTSPSLPDFHTDPSAANNSCGFYQYAWQAFLYLTAPAPGKGGALNFEILPSISEVSKAKATTKANKLLGAPTTFLDKRTNLTRIFQVRGTKPLSQFNQAVSNGILVDQAGNVTYYEHLFSKVAKHFVDSCYLNIQTCVQSTATTPAPAQATTLRFPAGSMEIKVSWRVITKTTPNANSYYTLRGVTVYNPNTQKNQPNVTLGLAGFHLVYATPGHPEMVWATFEHIDNAPNGPCSGATTSQLPKGFAGWAFNQATSTNCSSTYVNYWPTTPPSTPYPKTQVFRNYAYGSANGSNPTIAGLNSSVLTYLPANSVWRNFFLVGAVWTTGGTTALPAVPPNPPITPAAGTAPNEVGSTYLANATMETFQQWPNPSSSPGPQLNCFSCHNTFPGFTTAPFNISHGIGANGVDTCPYTSGSALPAACLKTQQTVPAHSSNP